MKKITYLSVASLLTACSLFVPKPPPGYIPIDGPHGRVLCPIIPEEVRRVASAIDLEANIAKVLQAVKVGASYSETLVRVQSELPANYRFMEIVSARACVNYATGLISEEEYREILHKVGPALVPLPTDQTQTTASDRDQTAGTRAADLNGQWYGLFREYQRDSQTEQLEVEEVTLHLDESKLSIAGDSSLPTRSWRIAGFPRRYLNLHILVLHYWERDSNQTSTGAIVVEGNLRDDQYLVGYWVGHDRDLNKLVACPYVLTRDRNIVRARTTHAQWLRQDCHPEGPN